MSESNVTDEVLLAPPLDVEVATSEVAAQIREVFPDGITPDRIGEFRAMAPDVEPDVLTCDGTYEVTEISVPGWEPADPEVSLLVCRPKARTQATGALYHVHGGGMVSGSPRGAGDIDAVLSQARELGVAVVSVDYRLAPEHPGLAPVRDCAAGLRWLVERGAELEIDPARVVVIGASAGGGLAAGAVLLARDAQVQLPLGQLLSCPMIDDRNTTVSARSLLGTDTWGRVSNETCWRALLGDAQGGPDVPIYAAPARATDLRGLPPTFIDVGSAETFRDESVAYASRLWACGGAAELHVWPGGYHGYAVFEPEATISVRTLAAQREWLQRIFG